MSFKDYLSKVLPRTGFALLIVSALFHLIDKQLVSLTQAELFAQEGASAKLWLYGGLSMVASMTGPLILLTLILSAVAGQSSLAFAKNHFSYLMKEHMRGFGKVFLWGLFLIIPGFWKFLQILFIPFVVALDPRYSQGTLDALEESKKIFLQKWGKTLGLFVLFGLFIPMLMTSFDAYRDLSEFPAPWAILVILDLCIFLSFQYCLLKLWSQIRRPAS